MDTQVNEKWSLGDSGRSVHNKTPAVRPKNWQRNNRKTKNTRQANGRIEKPKYSMRGVNGSVLCNIPEQSLLENLNDLRLYSSREKIADLSMDFKNNGIPNADEIPFTTTIEQSEFNHTFPKPIGWGRRKMDLGKTVTLDTRYPLENPNALESCLGILHSKMEPVKKPECAFCKRNNAKDFHHLLKDEFGGVVCPVLSAFTCKMCAATGRNAHTHKYCPVNPITKGDPVAAGMPPGRPLTKADKEWLKYFQTKYVLQFLDGSRPITR
ncbi:UNVERIFIED_CONTAM: hypothetical protein RMT77_018363 [Armadillidium vulgare]|nr:Nanos-like protein 1 [Armadillidium vulgare]